MKETQASITHWQRKTFGESTAQAAFQRMREEYWELRDALHLRGEWADVDLGEKRLAKAREECADVLITLYRVAELLGVDLHEAVDAKMKINRERRWVVDGSGNGQHVKDGG